MIDQAILQEIVTEIENLPEEKAIEVLDFVRFLKSRPGYGYAKRSPRMVFDEAQAAKLYAEAAEEDRQLSESGMPDYTSSLKAEDKDAEG